MWPGGTSRHSFLGGWPGSVAITPSVSRYASRDKRVTLPSRVRSAPRSCAPAACVSTLYGRSGEPSAARPAEVADHRETVPRAGALASTFTASTRYGDWLGRTHSSTMRCAAAAPSSVTSAS